MNSTTWLIIKKDLRRYWWLLVLWCGALLVRVSQAALWDDGFSADQGRGVFIMMFALLVNVVLIVRVIGEDSPFKEAAFWRTRPISGGQMLRAKLLFLGGWTLVLPCVVAAAGSWYYGFTASETLGVVAAQLILHTVVGGSFLVCALFTHRALVTLFGIWLVAAVVQAVTQVWWRHDAFTKMSIVAPNSPSLEWSQTLVVSLLMAAACVWAAALVYGQRARSGAAGVLVLGVLGSVFVNAFWRVDLLNGVPALAQLEAREDGKYQAKVTRTMSDAEHIYNGVSYRQLSAVLEWTGVEGYDGYVSYQAEGRLKRSDGDEITQYYPSRTTGGYDLMRTLRRMGVERVLTKSAERKGEQGVTLMQLHGERWDAFKQGGAVWSGWVSAKMGRIEPEARVPVTSGAVYRKGSARFGINDVVVTDSELRLSLFDRRPDVPRFAATADAGHIMGGSDVDMYALVNLSKSEAILASGGGSRGRSEDGIFQYGRRSLIFRARAGKPGLERAEWEEWLRGAELVCFRFVEERRVKVPVSVPVEIN